MLVNHYLGNMSTIDGAGTYLNMRPRTDLVEDFRSATMRWNPGLYLSLSAKDKEELEGSLEYKAVTRGINELSTRIREATTEDEKQQLKYQRRLEYDRRKAIENKRLREIQAAQKIIYDRGDDPHEQHDWRQIHFDRISHMLPPERLRLAKSMTLRAWPRSSEWVSVLKDLIALRENNDNAAYQEAMRPIQGYCAVPPCRKPMARYVRRFKERNFASANIIRQHSPSREVAACLRLSRIVLQSHLQLCEILFSLQQVGGGSRRVETPLSISH